LGGKSITLAIARGLPWKSSLLEGADTFSATSNGPEQKSALVFFSQQPFVQVKLHKRFEREACLAKCVMYRTPQVHAYNL